MQNQGNHHLHNYHTMDFPGDEVWKMKPTTPR